MTGFVVCTRARKIDAGEHILLGGVWYEVASISQQDRFSFYFELRDVLTGATSSAKFRSGKVLEVFQPAD